MIPRSSSIISQLILSPIPSHSLIEFIQLLLDTISTACIPESMMCRLIFNSRLLSLEHLDSALYIFWCLYHDCSFLSRAPRLCEGSILRLVNTEQCDTSSLAGEEET